VIEFYKYHGAKNDFILIDNRDGQATIEDPHLIRQLCDRRSGIGADGVLFVERSTVADYKMRIFNADGSIPTMCGNGIRCVVHFLEKEEVHIEVGGRIFPCKYQGSKISVDLGVSEVLHWPIHIDGLPIYVLNTGVPHAVFFADIDAGDFIARARVIRSHPAFSPNGVNVNCVEVQANALLVRTFERGVEGETLSCGTGAAAAAWVAKAVHGIQGRIAIKTRVGFDSALFEESLDICISAGRIEMRGPAHCVFTGHIII
jgi:diaminopimelate epimerase